MKRLMMIIMMVMLLVICTACSNTDELDEEVNLAIVLPGANSSKMDSNNLIEYIESAVEYCGNISIIQAQNNPYIECEIAIPDRISGISDSKWESQVYDYQSQILTLLEDAQPINEEVDLLSSINLAARSLESTSDGSKLLIVNHSGLSTEGTLNFQNIDLESYVVEDVVNQLIELEAIPNLNGVDVVWLGCADVTGNQEKLSNINQNKLIELWNAILIAGGANSVEFKVDVSVNTESNADLPYVTPIDVTAEVVEVIEEGYTIVLDEYSIEFVASSAQLLTEESEVIEEIQELIDYMVANTQCSIMISGTTAKAGSEESCISLSAERANTIKYLLISQGVLETQISTQGLGYSSAYYKEDLDADGNLIEEIAQTNRSVIIEMISE